MTKALELHQYDAVLFDLDGVLTDTASLHATCWKHVFDELLQQWAKKKNEPFRPFGIETDYREHVDGKNRLDGVRDFLASRGVDLAEGPPRPFPQEETIHGIAQHKDALFNDAVTRDGVKVYPGSVEWLRHVRAARLDTAVVSASHHCAEILQAAGIADQFDVRVDGNVADRRRLAGKPAPDMFLEAARELHVRPARAMVVEDALSGVQAGRAGRFGFVIGVARHGNAAALAEAGADRTVEDLSELLP